MSTRDDIPNIADIPGIDQLPREAAPNRDLWPEIEARLNQPEPVRRRPPALLRIAAALLLFASGVAVGHVWGRSPAEPPAVQTRGPLAPATEVQRAGTEYVQALAALRREPRAEVRGQGQEAAFAAMFGAAHELARLTPEDDTESEVLSAVSGMREARGGVRRAVHF
ncbi:MAG TPA: hypothetical protein VH394_27015 [Thermoanaerobaculia bacterium]|jgi:hypothetical protein|nr:hypothetical protein [Thermoanaerobaculia bacterium]